MKTIVLVSDLQVPYHSDRAVSALANFIQSTQPDMVASVGDEMDMPQVSRWNKAMAGEYEQSLSKHRDQTIEILRRLCVQHMMRSNHTDRLAVYLRRYAPALAELPELSLGPFFQLDSLGITLHKKPFELAPNWLLCHGDEGGSSQSAGGTALGIARKVGKSVCAGHTHKLGLQHQTEMLNGRINRTLWGFETGCLMDPKKADYIKAGAANWVQGFGILRVDGKHVYPVPVHVRPDGSFMARGKMWQA